MIMRERLGWGDNVREVVVIMWNVREVGVIMWNVREVGVIKCERLG